MDYHTLLGHVQALGIPIFDFANHLCNFTLDDEIGHGGAMTVYKASLRLDPQQDPFDVALKIPNQTIKETTKDKAISGMLAGVRQEIRIMKYLENQPHVVSLYGIAFRELKPILVVELAAGSLTEYLSSRMADGNRVSWETKARFCSEIADGIMTLHSARVVHGDIKADNILLFGNPADENSLVSKLSDFGYSSTLTSIASGKGTGGTPYFWAPECTPMAAPEMKEFANKPTKDNYSYGLYVWQVATDGEVPYDDMDADEIDVAKHSDKELQELMQLLPEDTPEAFRQVIVDMTQYNPTDRRDLMTAKTLLIGASAKDTNEDIRYAEVKQAFEIGIKGLSQDAEEGVKLGFLQSMSIPPSVKKRLVRTYEAAASKGDAEAAYFLSVCYGSEFGVKLDKGKMISWAIRAAEGGRLEAVESIASFSHLTILQLPENHMELFPWFLKAAETGYKSSQLVVANCYKYGICVEHDRNEYMKWSQKYRSNSDIRSTKESEPLLLSESGLHCAARDGNIEAVKFFIQQEGMDVNLRNSFDATPLQRAVNRGQIEVVKLLLTEFGADINVRDNYGQTSLYIAAANGHIEILKLLVELGADVNTKKDNGWAPVHAAASKGYIDIVKLLVSEFGADANMIDNEGQTPLYCAASNGTIEVIKLLVVDFGADVNVKKKNDWTPLHSAANNGHAECVKVLVNEYGANVDAKKNDGQTPLHTAANNGHCEVIKLLVMELGANVRAKSNANWTSLHFAARSGFIEAVKLLVTEFGCDVNAKNNHGETPLHLSAVKGYSDIVELLVSRFKADVNAKNAKKRGNMTPLHKVARDGHVETVRLLVLELGADTNIKDTDGQIPLHLAANYGHIDVVKLLAFEYGTGLNIKDNDGRTPLYLAATNGHIDTIKLLVVEFGSDVNIKDVYGWTPLHSAAQNGHIEVVKLLAGELGADVKITDDEGITPLFCAVGAGQVEIITVLLEQFHADSNTKDKNNQTILHWAVKCRQEAAIKILIEKYHLDIHAKDVEGKTPVDLADDAPVHFGIGCEGCNKYPIIGKRHKCIDCAKHNLCDRCCGEVKYSPGHNFELVELPAVNSLLASY